MLFAIFGLELMTAIVAFGLGYQIALGRKVKAWAAAVCPTCKKSPRGERGRFVKAEG